MTPSETKESRGVSQCNIYDDLPFQVAYENLQSQQAMIDDVTDRAQDVAKTSGDSRVSSQASQLASKYQAATVNAKVIFVVDQ